MHYIANTRFFLLTILLVLCGIFVFSCDVQAIADGTNNKFGLETVAGSSNLNIYGTDVPKILGGVVGTALSLVSVVFFLLLIYGGVVWMTARGDESKTQKGMDIIIAAIVGVIMILSAYLITSFILGAASKDSSSADTSKTDVACTQKQGQCQDNATAATVCKVQDKDGKYEAKLCNSKSSSKYLCCVPD